MPKDTPKNNRVKAVITLSDGREFYVHIKQKHYLKLDTLELHPLTKWEKLLDRFGYVKSNRVIDPDLHPAYENTN